MTIRPWPSLTAKFIDEGLHGDDEGEAARAPVVLPTAPEEDIDDDDDDDDDDDEDDDDEDEEESAAVAVPSQTQPRSPPRPFSICSIWLCSAAFWCRATNGHASNFECCRHEPQLITQYMIEYT